MGPVEYFVGTPEEREAIARVKESKKSGEPGLDDRIAVIEVRGRRMVAAFAIAALAQCTAWAIKANGIYDPHEADSMATPSTPTVTPEATPMLTPTPPTVTPEATPMLTPTPPTVTPEATPLLIPSPPTITPTYSDQPTIDETEKRIWSNVMNML
ncbi:MAG: hypothetical protein WC666_04955 [Candidatus Paceibacterota bacterium]|jgi:hypothetical protein